MSPVRYAFRTLLKTPVVTTVVVLSIALGIGANERYCRRQAGRAATTFLLSLVTLAAGLIPARRAARVDPMTALRYD